ncbi:hypothetical protein [Alteromonas sp. S015]|uniref:hypothetical protein n=1 Tax=Alteromonas sp. S015 TaxID=3117401 RepID=UPI002FDF3C2A
MTKVSSLLAIAFTTLVTSTFSFSQTNDTYFDFDGDGQILIEDIENLNNANMLSENRLEQLFTNAAPLFLSDTTSPGDGLSRREAQEYVGFPIGRINSQVTNDVMAQLWGGKTFYKNSGNKVMLDNRMLPLVQNLLDGVTDITDLIPLLGGPLSGIVDGVSGLVSIDAVAAEVYKVENSLFDGKPAVLLNYSETILPILQGIRDEIRLVDEETQLYIGRANIEIGYGSIEYAESVSLINTINGALINGRNCKEEMGGEYVKGETCFALWFALQPKQD